MEDLGADRALHFPAGCRRALPILNTAFGWGIDKGVIRFLDKDGQPVLTFEPQGAGEEGLIARTAVGETYLLDPKDQPAQIQRASASAASSTSERMVARFMTGPVPAPRTDPAKMPPFATVPGIYVVDRDPEREVCRVNLGIAMLEASGRYEARLLDGCRDNTLRVFDPVAWRYVAGRLTLQARQGDEVMLTLEREGQWRCTPDGGGTLVLRKATP